MPFATLSQLPGRPIFNGAITGHYAHLAHMTIGEVRLKSGTALPMHSHPHEQITFVMAGQFEFTVGSETMVLGPGMTALIPGGVSHGGKTLTDCHVIDLFSPVREDYR